MMEEAAQRFYLERFEDYLRFERGLATRTAAAYGHDLAQLVEFLEQRDVYEPTDVDSAELREYVYWLKESGRAPGSIRRKLSSIHSYFGFLQAEALIESDPSELLEGPKAGRKLPTVLTHEEIETLLASSNGDDPLADRDRAILELMYAAGLRISELITLRLRDVELNEQLVRVRGKGSKERIVPIGEPATQALQRYLRED